MGAADVGSTRMLGTHSDSLRRFYPSARVRLRLRRPPTRLDTRSRRHLGEYGVDDVDERVPQRDRVVHAGQQRAHLRRERRVALGVAPTTVSIADGRGSFSPRPNGPLP